MPVTESELAAVLDHCRSLIDAGDQLEQAARERSRKAEVATGAWEGPHRLTFNDRYAEESEDLHRRIRGLRSEAHAWARIWAEAVNRINRERRERAVEEISSSRGIGESLVDIFVGDDSGDQVRAFQPVPVPTEATRFAATGGLETF